MVGGAAKVRAAAVRRLVLRGSGRRGVESTGERAPAPRNPHTPSLLIFHLRHCPPPMVCTFAALPTHKSPPTRSSLPCVRRSAAACTMRPSRRPPTDGGGRPSTAPGLCSLACPSGADRSSASPHLVARARGGLQRRQKGGEAGRVEERAVAQLALRQQGRQPRRRELARLRQGGGGGSRGGRFQEASSGSGGAGRRRSGARAGREREGAQARALNRILSEASRKLLGSFTSASASMRPCGDQPARGP